MGIAVLEGDELIFWGIAGFRAHAGQKLLTAVERRLRGLVQTYQPMVLAIEEPTAVRLKMSSALAGIVMRIQSVATNAGLRFVTASPEGVRERMCGSERATHAQMAERMVKRFPHLERYGRCSSQRQEDYWRPMFSAVGVGVCVCSGMDAECAVNQAVGSSAG